LNTTIASGGSVISSVWLRPCSASGSAEAFYITDHYRNYPAMLVRLSAVHPDDLRELLEEAWRRSAPKRLVAARDASRDR